MKNILIAFIFFTCFIQAQQPAFPTAYGAGAYVTGGRGGIVLHVTNLNDSGTGSLRWALTDDAHKQVARYIVFDVSGVINLQSQLILASTSDLSASDRVSGNYTVNGFTAPEGGITIIGNTIVNRAITNIVWRGIKFRNGTGTASPYNTTSELSLITCTDFIVDRCSFGLGDSMASGGGDESDGNVGVLTYQNNLFTQMDRCLIIGRQGDSDDPILLMSDASIIRNVFSNPGYRLPNFEGSARFDLINNYYFNWDKRSMRMNQRNFQLNHMGNYYQPGQATQDVASDPDGRTQQEILFTLTTTTVMSPEIYDNGNEILNYNSYVPKYNKVYPSQPWTAWHPFNNDTDPIDPTWWINTSHAQLGRTFTVSNANNLESELFSTVGASQYTKNDGTIGFYRDWLDIDAITTAQNVSSTTVSGVVSRNYYQNRNALSLDLVNSEPSNTRPANWYNSSKSNNIPEVWYDANVPNGENENTVTANGYTHFENYANQVDSAVISSENPVITLNGNTPIDHTINTTYTDAGATANDAQDGNLTNIIVTVNNVDDTTLGTYTVTYNVTDSENNTATEIVRTVNVVSDNVPVTGISGLPTALTLTEGQSYQFTEVFSPTNPTNKGVVWSLTNSSFGSTTQSGLFTASEAGQVSITVTANDTTNGVFTDTCIITIVEASVSINNGGTLSSVKRRLIINN